MARTETQRFDQAVDYIKKQISPTLGADLAQKGNARKQQLGKAISLAKGGFWRTGTKQQHMALRGLLLCQQIYLKPPVGRTDHAKDGSETKSHFKMKGEDQVKEAIRIYTRKPNVSLEDFAQAALEDLKGGRLNWESRTRSDTSLGGTTNCYGAVIMWLLNSGCCSLPWYEKVGTKINAYNVNKEVGDGKVYPESDVGNIPRGYVFNIQDSKALDVCHWGVSLGGGWAAASNTTPGWIDADKNEVMVKFRKGGGTYGEFTLQSAVDVCKWKYDSHKVSVKAFDPTRNPKYY